MPSPRPRAKTIDSHHQITTSRPSGFLSLQVCVLVLLRLSHNPNPWSRFGVTADRFPKILENQKQEHRVLSAPPDKSLANQHCPLCPESQCFPPKMFRIIHGSGASVIVSSSRKRLMNHIKLILLSCKKQQLTTKCAKSVIMSSITSPHKM